MSIRFLDDESLGGAIVDLMRGSDLRCAVAFWGTGATERLFPAGNLPQDARIVCDISTGSTNPVELRGMGAPSNELLKYLDCLHAKVYISNNGAIVCSANASDNGIGFLDVAGLWEAGVFLESKSAAFAQAAAWFERIWKRAKIIDGPTLDRANETWKQRRRGRGVGKALSIQSGPLSLLATVAEYPERFRGIGFVFTTGSATKEDRDEAHDRLVRRDDKRSNRLISPKERKNLASWPVGDLFTGWSKQDLNAWPRCFVCIHRPRRRFSYWFYERCHEVLLEEGWGVVFAERSKGLRKDLGFGRGSQVMLATDEPLLDRIFAHCELSGRWLYENGERLVRLIEEIADS